MDELKNRVNILAGAEIHAGDGGYSIGNQADHDAFVAQRNKSLAEGRLRELALQAGYLPDGFGIGHWDMIECKNLVKFIVLECAGIIESQDVDPSFKHRMSWAVKKHFGVEE